MRTETTLPRYLSGAARSEGSGSREAGLAMVSRVNRWMIGGAIVVAGAVTGVAGHSFHAHTAHSAATVSPASRQSSISSAAAAAAAGLQAPSQAPSEATPQAPSASGPPGAGPVVSGGS